MATGGKIEQGTPAWFDMVGTVMRDAAERADLPVNQNVSLVERYTDGVDFGDGLVQGFRFDIVAGKPSYRIGVRPDEHGDITVEVASAVARAEPAAWRRCGSGARAIHRRWQAAPGWRPVASRYLVRGDA